MRAYTFYSKLNYSNDVISILTYLNKHGVLNIAPGEIEEYYQRFSHEVFCAGWMEINNDRLQEFSYWLAKQEI